MPSGKSGRKPSSGSSPPQKKSRDLTPTGAPTWPRLDLAPPELMLGGLGNWGRIILANEYLNQADRSIVEQAVKQLRSAEPEVLALLGKMRDAASARQLLEYIAAIAGSAYVIGAHGGMTDTARVFFEKSRAVRMRHSRATSRKEQELRAAIEAAAAANSIAIPSHQPYKDAERILTDVNQRLLGHNPVNVDVIARRLRPRSSRTRNVRSYHSPRNA